MWERLRRWIWKWLQPEPELDPYLDCMVKGKNGPELKRFLIVGSMGTRLVGQIADGSGEGIQLISSNEAVKSVAFWNHWNRFNAKSDLRWEDGTPYEPS